MIDSIKYGEIVYEGKNFKDIKIINKKPSEWTWKKSHTITLEDVQDMLDNIDVLVLGIGMDERVKVDQEVSDACDKKHIHVHVLQSESAMRLYNELEGHHNIGAILHSTC